MNENTVDDNRHCWFCNKTQPGRYLYEHDWLCLGCGTVEDLSEWPTPEPDGFKESFDAAMADPDFLDRLANHLVSPVWKEPLANPKPLTELHSADLHDGYYPDAWDDDETEDHL